MTKTRRLDLLFTPRRLDLLLMLGVFAFALALRITTTVGFDGLYGQDPYAYYNFAQTLRQTISQHGTLPAFFWPLGYPVLLAIGFTLFGTTPLTAQAITLLLGALLAPLVYVLARQIGAARTGAVAAGLIMGMCGQAIQSSFVVMSDIPALFWATVSAVILIHYLREEKLQLRWIVIAALTLAIACITRWIYLALIPVWAAALLLTWKRIRWRESFAAGAAAALILIPQAAVSIHSPYPVLDHAWVQGWSPVNAFSREFTNVDGHFLYPQINAIYYAQPYYDSLWLAPLFAPFLLIGLWTLRRKLALGVILLGWGLLPYLFLAGIPYQNIRFPLIVFPAVAALVGVGLDALFKRRYRLILAGLVVVGLVMMGNVTRQNAKIFIANQTNDKIAVQWAIQHIPAEDRLYTFSVTEPMKAYSTLDVHELYNESPTSIAAQLADGKESYIFLNVWDIENQWVGRDLQKTYHWLRDVIGLDYLDRIGNYSLFRVKNASGNTPSGVQQSVG